MRPSLDLSLSTVPTSSLYTLSWPSAVQFISPQISLSFLFLLYIYMCVYVCFISKDKRSGTTRTHHYFPRGKKRREKTRKGARIGVYAGWKRRVYALFLDNSGFYWIIPHFPTNKGASQICSGEPCIEHGSVSPLCPILLIIAQFCDQFSITINCIVRVYRCFSNQDSY